MIGDLGWQQDTTADGVSHQLLLSKLTFLALQTKTGNDLLYSS